MAKHKLARFAENLTFPNLFQVSFDDLETHGFEYRGRWNEYFGNDNPIVLELGCGKGEYTVALARRFPECNYIGVDIKGARMWRGAKTSNEEQMKNVAFIRTRIELIDRFFAPDEVGGIWITFPDPQPKKPNKRLTCPTFLARYAKILKPASHIHLKTDSKELYDYTLEEVLRPAGYTVNVATDNLYSTHADSLAASVQTYYEHLFTSQGKVITYIDFQMCNTMTTN